jgi:hypothetical protein
MPYKATAILKTTSERDSQEVTLVRRQVPKIVRSPGHNEHFRETCGTKSPFDSCSYAS